MCGSVSSTSATQTIAQMLDKLTKPSGTQQPSGSTGQPTDTMTISDAARQLANGVGKT